MAESIIALGLESRRRVDEIVDAALLAGGGEANDMTDQGGMYVRSFHDLDGHLWEVAYMDPAPMAGE
ncbi:polar amino acid transport system ATP-binding protein/hypothetical protein [Amycolatopsis arida]|uniref:VOC domain-containing protein n=1 Tax=Amycolatopsis arida TaxID=587909 RepID=A0A1I5M1S8_9PSEU|nr:hypothetical protein [Amycolatopsis arida]TDX93933.1 hypothetical protein CLV69_104390 [Amycolatopsis arida]SFP03475.1 polar amino acid transport system ATP-binding protein/hypothetical protein [Amycolatopsis arida]